ncbi:hypothetical protein CRG98_036719 [Punica granatum]|uniref:Uncharacterized protein n=1 Tax=Punica granatum TaxID=22663 RepID=A0A2I0IFY6_PUNGR|nr:hypothetical protein CRG98_036719 [Punica granatum]
MRVHTCGLRFTCGPPARLARPRGSCCIYSLWDRFPVIGFPREVQQHRRFFSLSSAFVSSSNGDRSGGREGSSGWREALQQLVVRRCRGFCRSLSPPLYAVVCY